MALLIAETSFDQAYSLNIDDLVRRSACGGGLKTAVVVAFGADPSRPIPGSVTGVMDASLR